MGSTAPDELLPVLDSLKPALKSMDIRTVAVATPSKENWENLITSIYVTEKTVDEVRSEHQKIPKLRNNQFAILLDAHPLDYTIFNGIIEGEIRFPTPFGINKIKFRKFNPLKLKVHSPHARVDGNLMWVLSTAHVGDQKEREELWSVVNKQGREAKLQGYHTIIALIKKQLRIDYGNRERKDFELVIPPLATIESAQFIESNFEVKIKKVTGLKDLQLILVLERSDQGGFYNRVRSDIRRMNEDTHESAKPFSVVTESFEIEDLLPYDLMNVELLHSESALTFDKITKTAPLSNVVEPFLNTLNVFCRLDKFKKMLFEPEKYGKNPDKIFENAVTWLLSLAGYDTIHLGLEIKHKKGEKKESFDVLRAEGGYEIGCADILAYEENKRLLLVDCDIGIDEKKIQKLVETGEYFLDQSKKYGRLEIIPVLVTPKDCGHRVEEGLRIVDCNALEMIFQEIAKGNRKKARDTFCYFGY